MQEFTMLHINNFRLKCTADWEPSKRGCSGSGPRAEFEFEAIQLASEDGWMKIGQHWACPSHVESFEALKEDGQ